MRRALALLGLAAVGGATLFLAGLLVVGSSSDRDPASPIPPDPVPAIQAQALLAPRRAHFGDTVTARVDVTLDRSRIDADSVRIATDFAPWKQIAKPARTRRDGETTTHLRTTWTLRCLASVCLPPDRALPLDFPPATVTYDARGGGPSGQQRTATWPRLVVSSRLDSPALAPPVLGSGSNPFEMPWRADMVSMPGVSYRVDPETASIPLFAGAGVFAVLGLALAYAGRPRRRPQPVPILEAPPEPVLTPLEQALALLEDPVTTDGLPDRRRALELVAAELAGRGSHDLALVARRLAWSQQAPAVERTTGLAERARPALGLDEEEAHEAEEAEDRV